MRLIMMIIPSNGFPEEVFYDEISARAWLRKYDHRKTAKEIVKSTEARKTKGIDEFKTARNSICIPSQVTPSRH
jgi:hypothetical protein